MGGGREGGFEEEEDREFIKLCMFFFFKQFKFNDYLIILYDMGVTSLLFVTYAI